MKTDRKQKVVHYKRAQFSTGEVTLQDALNQAIAESSPLNKACNRHEHLNQDSTECILINHHQTFNGMLFGQLIFIEYGKSQSFLSLDEESKEYVIEPLTLDSIPVDEQQAEKAKKRQFVDSILYFGVIENHIAVVQSKSLTCRNLEQHLQWLLVQSGGLKDGNVLILKDTTSPEVRAKLEKSPAKSLIIGTEVSATLDSTRMGSSETFEAEKVSYKLDGKAAKIFQALGLFNNDLNLEDALDQANLKMHVVLTYDRKTSESGQKVLDSIATSMRHSHDDDFQIKLKSGATIKGNELRISGKLSIEVINGSVNESGLCTSLQQWLATTVKQNL